MIHLQATGQHKNKAVLTHSPVYYPFASTHMANTQLLRVQIFSPVFEFALAEFCAKFTKINLPRIFPLLQYFRTKY